MAKRGRPKKQPSERKSGTLGVRVATELKEKIAAASKESGRTLSQEIETRLRMSFHEQQRSQDEFGGVSTYWTLHTIAGAIRLLEVYYGREWFADPYIHAECGAAMAEIWARLRPRGKARVPKGREPGLGAETGRGMVATLELALLRDDLGDAAFAAAMPVGTKIKRSALKEVLGPQARAGIMKSAKGTLK